MHCTLKEVVVYDYWVGDVLFSPSLLISHFRSQQGQFVLSNKFRNYFIKNYNEFTACTFLFQGFLGIGHVTK